MVPKFNLESSHIKIQNFQTNWDRETIKTRIVDLIETYNFAVDNFFYLKLSIHPRLLAEMLTIGSTQTFASSLVKYPEWTQHGEAANACHVLNHTRKQLSNNIGYQSRISMKHNLSPFTVCFFFCSAVLGWSYSGHYLVVRGICLSTYVCHMPLLRVSAFTMWSTLFFDLIVILPLTF
jgi:uncharacterized protein YutD